jgi:hypothetical protein
MKITKKLMMAAGLFFQLSGGLQALSSDQSQALNDALAKLGNVQPKSMDIKAAKATVDALGIADQSVSDSLKFYLTNEAPSAKKSAFKKTDDEMVAAINAYMNPKPAAPAPAQEASQDKAADKKSADRDCSALEAQVADLQAQLDAAKQKSLGDKSEAAGYKEVAQNLKAQLKAAQAESAGKPSQDQLAAAQGKLAALQAKMAAGDQSLQALIQATQSAQSADKYIPLAKKAAQSLKAAVDSIQDADVQLQVMDAIKAELNFKAPADKNAKQSQDMGRLGKKNKNKRRA